MNETTQTILTISQLLSIIVLGGTVIFGLSKIIYNFYKNKKRMLKNLQDQHEVKVTLSKDFTDKEYVETVRITNAFTIGSVEFPAAHEHLDKLINALTSIKKDIIQRQNVTKSN